MLIKKEKKQYLVFENWIYLICKNSNPLYPSFLLQSLVEIGPVVLEKRTKFWKVYNDYWQRPRQPWRQTTDKFWSEKLTWLHFRYAKKIAVFCGDKKPSKTNLGSTIHYTYTSYNKYFRLCMVSEELRLNEIGLFL